MARWATRVITRPPVDVPTIVTPSARPRLVPNQLATTRETGRSVAAPRPAPTRTSAETTGANPAARPAGGREARERGGGGGDVGDLEHEPGEPLAPGLDLGAKRRRVRSGGACVGGDEDQAHAAGRDRGGREAGLGLRRRAREAELRR